MLAGVAGATTSCKSAPQGPPAPLAVADGMKITMDMTVTLPDKAVESTVGKKPVTFTQGKHDVWPSLEVALAGMTVGEKKTIQLTADQAAGPYDDSKRRTVKMDQLPMGTKIGTRIRSRETGAEAHVVKIAGDSAEIDFNDRLAGKDLVVDVTILKVEKP
jgi:FKBP-type peptidyl-prolyl cis-trans isomerase 2